jgi:hypothetical protein
MADSHEPRRIRGQPRDVDLIASADPFVLADPTWARAITKATVVAVFPAGST